MKVIDAYWEKRNLGVNCTEIEVERDDPILIVSDILKCQNEYTVVKVPSSRSEVSLALQKEGFMFSELSIGLSKSLKNVPHLPTLYDRYENDIEIVQPSDKDINYILDDVASGRIFTTDRIALDPAFSAKISGTRYANWMKDLLRKDTTKIGLALYKNQKMAFGIVDNKDNKTNAVLGGLFSDRQKSTLGFLSVYTNTLLAYNSGSSFVFTHVSSNNPSILKLHLLFGYSINDLETVLIKHS